MFTLQVQRYAEWHAIFVQDKTAFAQILKKISRIQKTDGVNYIVLRDK
jgi:hypothetical protein